MSRMRVIADSGAWIVAVWATAAGAIAQRSSAARRLVIV